jgi:hypothetical protein
MDDLPLAWMEKAGQEPVPIHSGDAWFDCMAATERPTEFLERFVFKHGLLVSIFFVSGFGETNDVFAHCFVVGQLATVGQAVEKSVIDPPFVGNRLNSGTPRRVRLLIREIVAQIGEQGDEELP